MSDSLWPHCLQHTRLPCPSPVPEFTQTLVHWASDAIQPSCPLSSPSPPAFNLSQRQGFFQWVSSSYQGPNYWSFSFSISPSNEYSGLISFWMDWLDLLAVQGILKSLLQHHSSKASVHQCSAFFIVQLSHPYMATGKTIALTRWTFVGKVLSLLLICCLGCHNFSSKEQVSFNFMAVVTICSDFGAPQNKICHCFPFPCLFAMKWWDQTPLGETSGSKLVWGKRRKKNMQNKGARDLTLPWKNPEDWGRWEKSWIQWYRGMIKDGVLGKGNG